MLLKPILMLRISVVSILLVFFAACKAKKVGDVNTLSGEQVVTNKSDFVIAFGSCNKASIPNLLWDDVLKAKPDVWIWGGDNVYADTDDMEELKEFYRAQQRVKGYRKLVSKIPVIGTWDDHDYGLNDAGREFSAKEGSQQVFLDFMGVPKDSPRRQQRGVYTSHDFSLWNGSIKVIVLDTRFFRTAITPDTETEKRVKPNPYGEGTILGEEQWSWFENELNASQADFNIIMSSIQVLSNEHGFETWGNFPHEVDRLKKLIQESGTKGTIILSGDRHISEFSQTDVEGLSYPLIDFTSSGLTHAYRDYSGEPNPFRIGPVISTESFGLLRFDFLSKTVQLQMVGDKGAILNELQRTF